MFPKALYITLPFSTQNLWWSTITIDTRDVSGIAVSTFIYI